MQVAPAVQQKIVDADVVHDVQKYLDQPERLRGVLVQHGRIDGIVPITLAQSFDHLLTQSNVEHTYVEASGGNCDFEGYGDYGPVVKFMADHLVFEEP